MATSVPNTTQITPPRVPLTDERTGAVSREWYRWFYNIYNITGGGLGITPVVNGGTGLGTIPTNGQLLIGNGTGYTLNTLGAGTGVSVTNGAGTAVVANTGVLSNIAGTGISVSGATGNVTIANTGVLSFAGGTTGLTPAAATTGVVTLAGTLIAVNGGTGFSSYAVGDLLYANTTTTLAKLPDVATGNALISGGVGVAPAWGKIGLTTHVSGVLPIANGGTNGTATPTAGAVAYGTGTAYAFTAAGTAGQVLTSNGAGVPTWTTNAGGDVTGPASSTDNAIARFNSVTGKLIQNSLVIVDDTGSVTGVNSLTAESLTVNNNATFGTSNADTINFVGRINSDFDPATDNTYDLGRVGHEWRDLYIDGTANIDSLIADTADINAGTIDNTTIGATTPQNGSFVNLSVTGTTSFDGSQGTSGQVLTSAGTGNTPTWTTPTTGTVTSVSVVSANGLAGTVATATTTPAITLTTSVTGVLKGNGTAISAAAANTDYVPLSTVLTKTADYTITGTDTWIINNKTGSALTLTFPAASSWTGRYITVKNMQAQAVNSASSNIVPIDSTSAGTAILLAVVGNWATMVSDGTNWVIMQAAANNNLLLE
jgi:hypothetical protein